MNGWLDMSDLEVGACVSSEGNLVAPGALELTLLLALAIQKGGLMIVQVSLRLLGGVWLMKLILLMTWIGNSAEATCRSILFISHDLPYLREVFFST